MRRFLRELLSLKPTSLCEAIWRLLATRVERNALFPEVLEQQETQQLEGELERPLPDVFTQLKYVLHFERKPTYYAVNIIVPCCLLVIISLLVS